MSKGQLTTATDFFRLLLTINGAKLPFVGPVEDLLVEHFGLSILSLLEVAGGEVVLGFSNVGIVGAQSLFVDFQGALVITFDFLVLALQTHNKFS